MFRKSPLFVRESQRAKTADYAGWTILSVGEVDASSLFLRVTDNVPIENCSSWISQYSQNSYPRPPTKPTLLDEPVLRNVAHDQLITALGVRASGS